MRLQSSALVLAALIFFTGCQTTEFADVAAEDSAPAESEAAEELYATSALEIVKSFPVSGMECMDEFFDSYVDVFGINVIASGASDERLLHTAGVLAQYLDNDADGTPDDPAIAKYLADNNYVFPVWTVEVREEFWSSSLRYRQD